MIMPKSKSKKNMRTVHVHEKEWYWKVRKDSIFIIGPNNVPHDVPMPEFTGKNWTEINEAIDDGEFAISPSSVKAFILLNLIN